MSSTMEKYRRVLDESPALVRSGKRNAEQNRFAVYLYFADRATAEGVPFTREYLDTAWERPNAESTFGMFTQLLKEYNYLDDDGFRTDKPIPRAWNLRGSDMDQLPPVTAYNPKAYKKEQPEPEPEPEPVESIIEAESAPKATPTLDLYTVNKGLIIHEGGGWTFDFIPDDPERYYKIIDARWVDYYWWYIGGHRFAFVIDDEGRLKDRKPTVTGPNADPLIVGTAIVFGVTGSGDGLDFRSLTDAEKSLLVESSARRADDGAIVLTNVTMREFTPWTLEGSE